jgi:hypothetical protein
MEVSLQSARRALARLGERGRTTAVPDEVRQVLVAYAREQRKRGRSWVSIAASLGVSSSALIRWSQRGAPRCARAVPVEVRVEEPRSGAAVTLVSPAGYRIEGLAVSDALQALRELG